MTNNNIPMTLVEYFWKASQQIVMLTPNKAPNPDIEGWGSGFLLLYKGHRFLVTCDHNVHMESHLFDRRENLQVLCRNVF